LKYSQVRSLQFIMVKIIKSINPKTFLSLILGISVLARVIAAIYLGNNVVALPGTMDQISYHNLALRVLEGHGFTFNQFWWPYTSANQPTAHWSYLYTFYLVLVYYVFGPHPMIARLIQAIIVGILQPFLAYKIGEKIFGERVGLLASFFTAIYLYFIYYAATLMTEPFYITAILWCLWLVIQLIDSPDVISNGTHNGEIKLGFQLGLALTVAVLLRQLILLVIPFLLLWIWLARWSRKQKLPLLESTLALTILISGILPFTFFNYQRFHRFVLLNTNAGFAFFWGNNPFYGAHFQPILPTETYQQLIPVDVRNLDEAAMDQELLKRGIGFVISNPVRYILLSIDRIPDYFIFWPSPDSGLLSNLSRLFSFGIFLPFMLYGLLLALFNHSGEIQKGLFTPIALLFLFTIFYTTIHVLTWTLIRYRLPVDAVLLVFAGYGVADLYQKLVHRTESRAIHI
jgi:4-amino-4-deoxy-L-arabinose transferase-like glycosyltransferase